MGANHRRAPTGHPSPQSTRQYGDGDVMIELRPVRSRLRSVLNTSFTYLSLLSGAMNPAGNSHYSLRSPGGMVETTAS